MIDYEELILIRQELQEIFEDDPEDPAAAAMLGAAIAHEAWWDDIPDNEFEVFYK